MWFFPRHARTLQRRTKLRGPRLAIEALEDRSVPAAFLVDTLADGGDGSLRQAVLDANDTPGADQIRFARNLHGTIALQLGEMAITDDLTVHGPGSHRLTLSGENQSRIFRLSTCRSRV
jgi:hypothetical protein